MSSSFSNQTLAQVDLWANRASTKKVYTLPKVLDEKVAALHLESSAKLTKLRPDQADYIGVPSMAPTSGALPLLGGRESSREHAPASDILSARGLCFRARRHGAGYVRCASLGLASVCEAPHTLQAIRFFERALPRAGQDQLRDRWNQEPYARRQNTRVELVMFLLASLAVMF